MTDTGLFAIRQLMGILVLSLLTIDLPVGMGNGGICCMYLVSSRTQVVMGGGGTRKSEEGKGTVKRHQLPAKNNNKNSPIAGEIRI